MRFGLVCALTLLGSVNLIGCNGTSGAEADSGVNLAPIGSGVPVSVKRVVGSSFEALSVGGDVYYRGTNPNLGLSAQWIRFAQSSQPVADLSARDSVLCFETYVSQRPQARNAGEATYCFGVASLYGSYSGYAIVFTSPNFLSASHGDAGVSYVTEPFMGADLTLSYLEDQTLVLSVHAQGTEENLTCNLTATDLVCANFTVPL